jgi:hypothetical protein
LVYCVFFHVSLFFLCFVQYFNVMFVCFNFFVQKNLAMYKFCLKAWNESSFNFSSTYLKHILWDTLHLHFLHWHELYATYIILVIFL